MRSWAARLACAATLAWLASWTVHAIMALERPLGVYGPICGSPGVPAPDAPCPACEAALAAGAGPLAAPHSPGNPALRAEEPAPGPARLPLGSDRFSDAPARAPPRQA